MSIYTDDVLMSVRRDLDYLVDVAQSAIVRDPSIMEWIDWSLVENASMASSNLQEVLGGHEDLSRSRAYKWGEQAAAKLMSELRFYNLH